MSAVAWSDYTAWMLRGNAMAHALICNREDGCMWSSSSENFGFKTYKDKVVQEDGSEMDCQIDEEKGWIEFAKTLKKPQLGFRANQVKYALLRDYPKGNPDSGGSCPTIFLKAKGSGACVCVTDRAIVIGVWEEASQGQQASVCNKRVEDVAEHLKSVKF